MSLSLFTVESLDQAEDYLILAAMTDGGRELEADAARRLISLPGRVLGPTSADGASLLQSITHAKQEAIQRTVSQRNARFFEAEAEKLDGWSDDLKLGLEREIKELDREIKQARSYRAPLAPIPVEPERPLATREMKEARRALLVDMTLEEKLAKQKQIKALESQRNQKRRSLFDAQDEVDKQREKLIAQIEGKLEQRRRLEEVFTVRWTLY